MTIGQQISLINPVYLEVTLPAGMRGTVIEVGKEPGLYGIEFAVDVSEGVETAPFRVFIPESNLLAV